MSPKVAMSVPVGRGFGAPGQRLYDTRAAYAHSRVQQRIQETIEHRVDGLLGDRSLIGEPKGYGQLLVDLKANGVRQGAPTAVALIGQQNRGLQNGAAGAVHVELTPRKPAQVARVRGVEQQQRRL